MRTEDLRVDDTVTVAVGSERIFRVIQVDHRYMHMALLQPTCGKVDEVEMWPRWIPIRHLIPA